MGSQTKGAMGSMRLLQQAQNALTVIKHRHELGNALLTHLVLAGQLVHEGKNEQARDLLINMRDTFVEFVERGGRV